MAQNCNGNVDAMNMIEQWLCTVADQYIIVKSEKFETLTINLLLFSQFKPFLFHLFLII